MAYDNGHLGVFVAGTGFASASRLLTSAETQTVTTELTNDPAGRGYKQGGVYKDSADITALLNGTYSIPNPAAQGTVNVTELAQVPFLHTLADLLVQVSQIASTSPNYQAAQGILSDWEILRPIVITLPTINPQQTSFVGIFAALVSIGVLTQAQVTALTTQPDPAWQATLPQPSRMAAIGLPTVTVQASDIQTITGVA